MRRRVAGLIVGAGVAAAYVAVALGSFQAGLLPVRPLYDGGAPPPPYRWVIPPPDLAATNQQPAPGEGVIALTPQGSAAATIATNDGQTIVAFQPGSIAARAGETQVRVSVTPLDPASIGSPPSGYDYDGNAYRVTAKYATSGADAEIAVDSCPADVLPKVCPSVVLRFPLFGTEMFRSDGTTWTRVESHISPASLQLFGDTPTLGDFVVAGPNLPPEKKGSKIALYLAIGLGAGALSVSIATWRSRSARRWLRRTLRGTPSTPQRPRSASRGPTPPRGVQKKKRKR